jgi:hypothetical protein
MDKDSNISLKVDSKYNSDNVYSENKTDGQDIACVQTEETGTLLQNTTLKELKDNINQIQKLFDWFKTFDD